MSQTKNMLKRGLFLIVILAMTLGFSFVGCVGPRHRIENVSKERKQCDELLRCLSEDDAEGLKAMFCERALTIKDIDEQIQTAMEFFDGKAVTHVYFGLSGEEYIKNGRIVEKSSAPHIQKFLTDSNKNYEIRFQSYLVYLDRPEKVGISDMHITNTDTEEVCDVGDYYVVFPRRR